MRARASQAIANSDRLRLDPIGNNIVSPRFILSVYSSLSHSRFYPFSQKQYTNNSPLLWLFAVRLLLSFLCYVVFFCFGSNQQPTRQTKRKYVTCVCINTLASNTQPTTTTIYLIYLISCFLHQFCLWFVALKFVNLEQ